MTFPKSTRTLPERPNLEHLKNEAKSLLAAYRQRDLDAVAFVERYEQRPDPVQLKLSDAQRIVARAYGFASWVKLKEHLATDAIKRGDQENLRALIRQSSNPSAMLSAKIDWAQRDGNPIGKGITLLQLASFFPWKQDTASTLLGLGATVDFHSACGLGDVEAIASILQTDPAAIESQVDGYYPLQFAITGGQPDALRYLLESGDDANRSLQKVCWFVWEDDAISANVMDWKPIHMATLWGFDEKRTSIAAYLRDFGADLDACSPLHGYRPIHLAAMSCKVEMLKYLVASGVDVDSRAGECHPLLGVDLEDRSPIGGYDWTPLMVAAGEGHLAAVDCLANLGADLSAVNSVGQTALHFAAAPFWGENLDMITFLIDRGADVTAKDIGGNTAADFALVKGYQETVQRLNELASGANRPDD
jgi:ankyrin repeat protein